MKKAIVIYGSTTGNTETLSKYVGEGLKASGVEVMVKNVTESGPEELKDYDVIVLGCSTWGDGELQDDFVSFEEEMRKIRLDGKKGAVFGPGDSIYPISNPLKACLHKRVFGPGDSIYPQFCKAVDTLEERLKSCGAEIIIDSLKIDGDIQPQLEKAEDWGKNLGEILGQD